MKALVESARYGRVISFNNFSSRNPKAAMLRFKTCARSPRRGPSPISAVHLSAKVE